MLARLRAGDAAAFDELVTRHDATMRRVARTFVPTRSLAEDVVQETWLGVIRGLDRFEGRSSLRTWIFQILANRARTRATREARTLPFSSVASPDRPTVDPSEFSADGHWRSAPARLDCDPETSLLQAELRRKLLEAVDDLPAAMQAVIMLRDVVGLPPDEVCDMLAISDGNQRVTLHRARARVRAALSPLVEAGG